MSKINKITIRDTSKHYKYKIQDVFVYTPYEIYESQNTFIQNVLSNLKSKQNALIQSPTGTGKTMSLLCSTLAWAMDQQQTLNSPPPQIIYASRTHAQLKQVVSQINKLCYQVKLAILSSRDQACINEDLKLLRGQDKELQCRLRIASRRGLECPFYKNEAFYQKQADLGKQMNLEEIVLKGKLQKFCPFFYERYSKVQANIVLIPYNYLFDKKIWSNEEGFRLQGSILILDEAHNIQSVCEQYRQHSINLSTFTRATQNAEDLRMQKLNENKNELNPGTLGKVKMLKVSLQDIEINAMYIQLLYEHIQTLDIPSDPMGVLYNAKEFAEIIDNATDQSQFGSLTRNIKEMIKGFQSFRADMIFSPFWALEAWMKFIEKMAEILDERQIKKGISQFKIQVAYEGSDIKITIHCLDPSSGFKEVVQEHKPRSIILTSGTLSPLKAWPLQLQVDFAKPLSCPHVISPQQTNTVILGMGPSEQPLDTKYQNRKSQRLYEDIGRTLYQIVKYTPNGVVVLFPSYSFLEQTKTYLTNQKILTKLYQLKNIYFERRDSSDFSNILDRYMKEAESNKGAILCALIRGKIAQGLDFSQKKCRAVVLVGVPYPCVTDVKVKAKMAYLDALKDNGQKRVTGTEWYFSETIRAINQGIGRLIRTPDDFGTVYLVDSRFAKPDIEVQLASWARMNITKVSSFKEFVSKVKQINKVTDTPPQLTAIQHNLGLVSTRGVTLEQQNIVLPPRSSRQSISQPFRLPKTEEELNSDKIKHMSLQQLVTTMKSDKDIKDLEKKIDEKQLQENKDHEKKITEKQLLQNMEKHKESYEKKIFTRKTVKALREPKSEQCPICQLVAPMVKSNTCNHTACQQCWDKWLQQDLRCPICRGRVRKNFLVEVPREPDEPEVPEV